MGPADLEAAVRNLADRHGATFSCITGEELLARNFPMIHAVGRAAATPPRLIDLAWGALDAPKVTLVGKGVCFDSGGLDIKPAAGMLLMKKDMGGAANVLGLAHIVMEMGLPVRLRVLIPAVENSIGGDAFRPGDILTSRKGVTVEVGNTDAEGRLVLADALALADEEAPDLLLDMATLTGAARVALGPELPALFTDDGRLAADLTRLGAAEHDPTWRLPLWRPYEKMLESKIADTNNVSAGGFAGAITAALFLSRFVAAAKAHVHFDLYAWVASTRPGRPEGGEAQVIRALYALLKERYGR
jgi:leucyl aminopeptidase